MEQAAFAACSLRCTGEAVASAIAWVGDVPVAWSVGVAAGEMTVFGSPFGAPAIATPVSDPGVDASLASPYPLLSHVSTLLDAGKYVFAERLHLSL